MAKDDVRGFFERKPQYNREYFGKEVLIALCQGAALHYVDHKNGVKDFDVWFIYPMGKSTFLIEDVGLWISGLANSANIPMTVDTLVDG